jgi:hypothetical protein
MKNMKLLNIFVVWMFAFSLFGNPVPISAQDADNDILYTSDADFDRGTLASINHDAPYNNQLQLDSQTKPFPFINVAASGRGTVVRTNTKTGEIVGEYRTAPEGRGLNPSRTTVDLFGNVWTANRDESDSINDVPHGSTVKIGIIVGGTRVDETGLPKPDGEYLAPPFDYNTCVDRDADGLIRTSQGLNHVLDWPDITDGQGGTDGVVQDAVDECILIYQRLPNAESARHVSVDADNNVWVGGYPFVLRMFYKLDSATGAILDSFDARKYGCGGYGGLIDGNGILWSVGGPLLRYDPVAKTGFCIHQYGYGLSIDTNGYIWMSLWDGGIVKIAPDGTVMPGFPKSTHPSSMTTLSTAASDTNQTVAPSAQNEASSPTMPLVEREPVTSQAAPARSEAGTPITPLANGEVFHFQVAPVDDWVQSSSSWTPGATITLTIEDGSNVLYSTSQMADSNGYFNFNLWDMFDLQRGQVVTVSDGTTIKSHTIMPLYVDGLDITTDTVFGRAKSGDNVDVWVHGDGWMSVATDGSGNWIADFTGQTDLTYLSNGGSQQVDSDGDSTVVGWASPKFQVAPVDNWVQSSSSWTPGATISLTIKNGGTVVYSDAQIADINGYFNFNLWNVFDLQRGQVVIVSDGTTTKTHTVTNLFVNNINVITDNIFGQADSGTSVDIWVHGNGGMTVTADSGGNWTADFSSMTDLTYLSDGGSQQTDDDGDSTGVWWSSPRFQVSPEDDWVQSWRQWTPGATISLTIKDSGVVVYTDSQIADADGNFNFNLWDVFDLQRGQEVTVSDGTTTKTHTVLDLFVDGVDVTADDIFGRAEAGASVDVWVHGNGGMSVTADSGGNWTADFSGMTDLTYLSDGGSQQIDNDGDATGVWWASPRFQVAPEDDWIQSWSRWSPGATISLTIKDSGVVVYTDSQIANTNGNFNFNLWDVFDLQRGQEVTISDGTSVKSHTVMPLYVDGVDLMTDTIFGRADANTDVEIWVHGDGNKHVTADGSGNWTANFSGQSDLTYLSDGGSQQTDDDGDSTGVWWSSPSFQVAPDDHWIQSWNRWTPQTTISLTIKDGGIVIYTDTQMTDDRGFFNFNVWDVDLVTGHQVVVSDGTIAKTHTVTNVNVDEIDADADQIRGTANPGARVWVWAYLFNEGSGRSAVADSSGNWMVDFSKASDGHQIYDITDITRINANEFDDDGDSTYRQFGPPTQQNRGVAVTPSDNHVWIANSGVGTVTRLDNDGNIIKIIDTGQEPTGVAVDAAGKVWATNMGSNNAVRIDPNAGTDGLGAIDLTVDLGPDAWPYNYSDMTGAVVVGSTSPQGFWTVVQDSQTTGFEWGRIIWNTEPQGNEPPGTAIVVEARSADTEAGLGGQAFQPVMNGEPFSMFGRFIEVRVTLKASPSGDSPALSDIRVQPHVLYVDIDIKPGSDPNGINCKNKKEEIAVAVLSTDNFDALTVDHTTVTFEGAKEIHVVKKTGIPHRHVEDVDFDGDMDLVFHFMLRDTTLACDSTTGQLYGLTYGGIPIEGTDSVWMISR